MSLFSLFDFQYSFEELISLCFIDQECSNFFAINVLKYPPSEKSNLIANYNIFQRDRLPVAQRQLVRLSGGCVASVNNVQAWA